MLASIYTVQHIVLFGTCCNGLIEIAMISARNRTINNQNRACVGLFPKEVELPRLDILGLPRQMLV
jgi:hypothetical protein